MPLHSYFVFIAFSFLIIAYIAQYFRLKYSGLNFVGTPSIENLYFFSGKFAIIITWALFMVKAIFPMLGYLFFPSWVSWFAVILLFAGVAIITVAMMNLGSSYNVGLPGKQAPLQTRGLYRLSRNPLYLGMILISCASCIYFLDLINVSFTIYGMYMHHKIILQEEAYLGNQYGNEWLIYRARVSRYL